MSYVDDKHPRIKIIIDKMTICRVMQHVCLLRELCCLRCHLVEETDIMELEKRYWVLKAQSSSGRFDLDTFRPIVSPPVPSALCEGQCYGLSDVGLRVRSAISVFCDQGH